MTPENISGEKAKEYEVQLTRAMRIGDSILKHNGSALDAVQSVVTYLEDCPLFNAGRGAVFNAEGVNELDASIMDGSTLKAGAVAGVRTIRNPIRAARKVMENTGHVMLAGAGAEAFARGQGLEIVDPSYFSDPEKLEQFRRMKQQPQENRKDDSKGTVGAVAMDTKGNLAAATSTGGLSNKKWGRIGDSPIIGAGTYADNATCAVSCTGTGEYFIRLSVAYSISAKMKYGGMSLAQASATTLEEITALGGDGGFIAIDAEGNYAMPFNTSGMFRGFVNSTGEMEVKMYK
jgi:beta-aspartyl-peptidase (threonine type)